ncbi:hypothetical protein H5T89_08600 [bacterium]|nr:hypothetical protein [bacterium]
MKLENFIHSDRIEIYLYGDKSKDYIAKLELYHWKVMKELGIDITDLLKIAFGGG